MIASPVLNAVARALVVIDAIGPDPQINQIAQELRIAEMELHTLLNELQEATDGTARLYAMRRVNHKTRWATLLIKVLADLLTEPVYTCAHSSFHRARQ